MRVLGIDYGERRVGLAVSDPTGTIASPAGTLQRRRGKRPPIRALEEAARANDVEAIVLGLPLQLDGTENEWCAEVRQVGKTLTQRLGLPVHFVDERLTSVQAERVIRSMGLPKKQREQKTRIDESAAALILQRFLDGGSRT